MAPSLRTSIRALLSTSDEQLMWRVQKQDDEHAFAQLVRRWQAAFQRVCVRMLGDEHLGSDLAQETFVRVFAKRKEYQPDAKFSTWAWRIALNLCYDELRRRTRRNESSLDEPYGETMAIVETFAAAGPAPDQALCNREQSDCVREALMQLPQIYRTVVILRHYEDLKFREIADLLGVPEGTVKSRTSEALTQLGRLLRPGAPKEPSTIKKLNRKESLIV
ncbi:MAG TPA: sigma-70 family RNA polymerase sigma factor [Candidatus Limnocylindrales bacterium]|nr:sigma-70 family RNA polymerase sigma factor [Candidatus Limnocylindrales bacterium]